MPTRSTAPTDARPVSEFAGVRFEMPPGWQAKPSTSSARIAQYALPGADGDAELIVFFFGAGGAGGRQANVDRWIGQFSRPDAGKVESSSQTFEQDGLTMTVVRASGAYAPAAMAPDAPPAEPKPDYALYGIIVEGGPKGALFVRTTGPKATIDQHQSELDHFARSARQAE